MQPTTETPGPSFSAPSWWPWALGLLLGMIVLGPALNGGSLLSLDLLVTPDIPVPNGVYGLGPALSQRVPLFALLGLSSAVVGGPVTIKVAIVVWCAAGFAGAARLARLMAPVGVSVGVAGEAAAGLLWAVGPFALTRISAGHINLLWVVAVLPWALPRLCRPADHVPSTFLAAVALAIGGPGGGTLGVAMGLIALVVQARRGQVLRPLLAIVVPQAMWILPTAVLLWAGAGVNGAGRFATTTGGSASWPAVAVGNGFWRADVQVGAAGWVGVVVGLAVAGLAAVGGVRIVSERGVRSWAGTAAVVAVVGLVLAVASATPGVREGYDWLSRLPVGAPLRESHRFVALWLVWAAPAMAVGAAIVATRLVAVRRSLVLALPVVLALAVSVPGWWGLDGRLQPVEYPSGWRAARSYIQAHPGTAVALPWSEYPPLSFADGRQVFNPLPDYFGGDVISSYDPLFGPGSGRQEQVDPRAQVIDRIVRRAQAGELVGDRFAEVGVRWVIVAHEIGWDGFGVLDRDPAVRPVLRFDDLDLYEVVGWSGRATAPDGSARSIDRPIPPIITTDAPKGSTLHVAGAPGWVQGWSTPVAVTRAGELRLEGDGGVLWFWPASVLVVADVALLVGVVLALRSRRARFGRILDPGGPRG